MHWQRRTLTIFAASSAAVLLLCASAAWLSEASSLATASCVSSKRRAFLVEHTNNVSGETRLGYTLTSVGQAMTRHKNRLVKEFITVVFGN